LHENVQQQYGRQVENPSSRKKCRRGGRAGETTPQTGRRAKLRDSTPRGGRGESGR